MTAKAVKENAEASKNLLNVERPSVQPALGSPLPLSAPPNLSPQPKTFSGGGYYPPKKFNHKEHKEHKEKIGREAFTWNRVAVQYF